MYNTVFKLKCSSLYHLVEVLVAQYIGDVLVFFTGTNLVPPLGFDKTPTVTFLDQNAISPAMLKSIMGSGILFIR